MNRYNSYRDSGVVWIDEIPSHWIKSKFKYESSKLVQYGLNTNSERYVEKGVRFLRTTDINDFGVISKDGVYIEEYNIPQNYILEKFDFLISRSGTLGRSYLHLSDDLFSFAGYLVRFNFENLTKSKFVFYFTKSKNFFDWISLNTIQSTIGNVNGEKYSNLEIIIPPLQEQEQIVAYLDKKTAIVDTLIASKEQKINLLKENRTSLINHTITKGLDSNVEFKDSGVEWIGEIPTHWEKLKIRNILSKKPDNGLFKRKDDFVENDGFGFVNVADLFNDNNTIKIDKLSKVIVTKDELNKAVLEEGDIFFVRSSLKLEGIGVSSIVINIDKPLVYDCHIIRIKPDKLKISPLFLIKALNSSSYRNYLVSVSETTTMTTISQDKIKDLIIFIPNVSEQQKIVEHLDKQTQEIDELISLEQKKIETLKEYRQALISEVVTGKIKVVK
jgi:type I restriction enzyme S subunit